MTKLRKQMMQDLDLGGYAKKTKQTYVDSIRDFAKFHGRSPAQLGQDEARAWVEHLQQRKPKLVLPAKLWASGSSRVRPIRRVLEHQTGWS